MTAAAMATALILTPIVSAWSSFGAYEPDTTYDNADWMWAQPGPASGDRIYFNAWSAMQATVNANVGALQTTNEAPTEERHQAILGVWVDCNADGYVGHAESALYEYSSTLLLDDSICPPITGDVDDWVEGAHNYNGWVSELIPIGWPTDNEDGEPSDSRVYVDPAAKMWADQGRPGDALEAGDGSCALTPFPRGTMQSTGGLLNYLDCGTDTMESWNDAMAQLGDPLGLSFPNDDDANGSPLDVDTFGDEHTDHAAVGITDCAGEPTLDTGAEVNSTGAGETLDAPITAAEEASGEDLLDAWQLYTVKVPALDPRTLNTEDPTVPGQLNQTNEEVVEDCDTSNDAGRDFYSLLFEDDWNGEGTGETGKTASGWSFQYYEGPRGFYEEVGDTRIPEDQGTAGMPYYLGLGAGYSLYMTSWYGIGNLVRAPSAVVVRANANDPGADVAPGYHLTFYAYVSPAVTAGDLNLKTPGGQGIYGSSQCGDQTSGVHNGWNCDREEWNLNGDGTPISGAERLAFVGDAYNLRDVDCYDGSTNLGVGLGLPYYGNEPCVRPS